MKRTAFLVLLLQLTFLTEVRAIEFWNFTGFTNSQNTYLNQLESCRDWNNKSVLFAKLSREYQSCNLNLASAYADSALKAATFGKSLKLISLANQVRAEALIIKGQAINGHKLLKECLTIAKRAHLESQIPYLYCWQSYTLIIENNFEQALTTLNQAKNIFVENQDTKGLILIDYLQSQAFSQLQLYDIQIEIIEKIINTNIAQIDAYKNIIAFDVPQAQLRSEKTYSKTPPQYLQAILLKSLISHDYTSCGKAYTMIGEYYLRGQYYSEAIPVLYKAASHFTKMGSPALLGTIYTYLSHAFQELGQQELNILYTKKALNERLKAGHTSGIVSSYMNLGYAYANYGDDKNAERYYITGFNIADTFKLDMLLGKLSDKLYTFYKSKKNTSEALKYIKVKGMLFEKNNSKFNSGMISYLMQNYEQNTHKQSIQLNNRKTQYSHIWLLITILLLGTATWGVFHAKRLIRYAEQERYDRSREMLLRLQMNPHFIFNALLAVQSFIFKKNPESAVNFLDNFSGLIQRILRTTRSELIPLSDELEITLNYLNIQKTRFGEKFDYTITLDPSIRPTKTLVAPMLLQPFLENAIEHAFSKTQNKGILLIKYRRDEDRLIVEVEDNGPGIESNYINSNSLLTKNPFSMALKITSERIAILNKRLLKDDTTFKYFNLYDTAGTVAGLKITFATPFKGTSNEAE
jgi:hypothetical protein